MISFNPNYLQKGPTPNTDTLWVGASTYKFWGRRKHSVQNNVSLGTKKETLGTEERDSDADPEYKNFIFLNMWCDV